MALIRLGHSLSSTNRIASISCKQAYRSSSKYDVAHNLWDRSSTIIADLQRSQYVVTQSWDIMSSCSSILNKGAGRDDRRSRPQKSDVESSFGLSDLTISSLGKCNRAECQYDTTCLNSAEVSSDVYCMRCTSMKYTHYETGHCVFKSVEGAVKRRTVPLRLAGPPKMSYT